MRIEWFAFITGVFAGFIIGAVIAVGFGRSTPKPLEDLPQQELDRYAAMCFYPCLHAQGIQGMSTQTPTEEMFGKVAACHKACSEAEALAKSLRKEASKR